MAEAQGLIRSVGLLKSPQIGLAHCQSSHTNPTKVSQRNQHEGLLLQRNRIDVAAGAQQRKKGKNSLDCALFSAAVAACDGSRGRSKTAPVYLRICTCAEK
jgi:hypothetical protein